MRLFTGREVTIKIYTDSFQELSLVQNFNAKSDKTKIDYKPLETGKTEVILTGETIIITFDYPLVNQAIYDLYDNKTIFDLYRYYDNEDEVNTFTYKYENCKITDITESDTDKGIILKVTVQAEQRIIVSE
jgi:hypothetical protein